MATFLIALFSVVLVLTCLFVTLLVLMQKPSANSGMGAALGGGAAEQAFGGEAGNVLTRGTNIAIIVFFILCFGLYLATLATVERDAEGGGGASISSLGSLAEEAVPAEGSDANVTPPDDGEAAAAAALDESIESPDESVEVQVDEPVEIDVDVPSDDVAPLNLEDLDLGTSESGS